MRVSMRFAVIIAVVTMGMSTLSLGTANPVGAQSPKRFVIVGAGGSLPADFEALIGAAGGTVVHQMDQIGVAVVESSDPSFLYAAADIAGVQGVAEDVTVELDDPADSSTTVAESLDTEAVATANPASAGFFPVQWNMRTIGADSAWAAGFVGDPQVRVAVIDTGIDYTLPDLVGKVDMELSRSFYSEPLPPDWMLAAIGMPLRPFLDVHRHGTHVAGIIAAAGVHTAGIAPGVTLIAVKVCGRPRPATPTGCESLGTIVQAIVYAADAGADVINLSIGDKLEKRGRDNALLMAAFNRAVNHAHKKGALLVASAGNNAINWDSMGNTMKIPAQLPHVAAVSATGPYEGVVKNATNDDLLGVCVMDASPKCVAPNGGPFVEYTDHGNSVITLAAPGGSMTDFRVIIPGLAGDRPMPVDWIVSPCARFTGCITGNAVVFMTGTSMAAAHVSGVAALVDSAYGGALTGDQILRILLRTADDLGKPGKDEFYGFGRINASRAVTGK